MKKVVNFLFAILSCLSAEGQNLVQNPSFENYTSCPNGYAQISNAVGWSSFRESCDYFNSCGWSAVSTPSNIDGYQIPSTGNAYAGIIIFDKAGFYREIIGNQLSSPLAIGQKYYVSFYTSLAISKPNNCYASNNIGAKFTTIAYNAYVNQMPINNAAALYSSSIISDTTNWTLVSGSFTADSAYQYIAIGNFFDDLHTDTSRMASGVLPIYAYYYVDDIYVGIDTTHTNDCSDKIYLPNAFSPNADGENDSLQIYYSDTSCIKSFHIAIYNRWGENVFESTDSNFRWDGIYKGKTINTEVLTYVISVTYTDERIQKLKGNVTLMR